MAEGRSNVLRPPGFEGGHDGSAYLAGMQARIREENTQRRQLTWAAQAGRRWVGEFRAQQFRTAPPGVASLTLCDTYPGAQARGRQPLPVGHGTRLGHVLSRGLPSFWGVLCAGCLQSECMSTNVGIKDHPVPKTDM
jgi:hypothetical protein